MKRKGDVAETDRRSALVALPANVEEGWLRDEVAPITLKALNAIPADELYVLLTLDKPDVESGRPWYKKAASAARARVTALGKLAGHARALRDAFAKEGAVDKTLWLKLLGGSRPYLARDLDKVTRAIESLAANAAEIARLRARRYQDAQPRHDAKGGQVSTAKHARQLVALDDALDWTLSDMAKLILASGKDWINPPCPDLARTYQADPASLQGWLKTRLRRARKSTASVGTKTRNQSKVTSRSGPS